MSDPFKDSYRRWVEVPHPTTALQSECWDKMRALLREYRAEISCSHGEFTLTVGDNERVITADARCDNVTWHSELKLTRMELELVP